MALVSLWVLLGCVLGVLNLCSPASGFARCVTIKAPSSAHRGRDKSTALRLAAQQEQQGKDDITASSANVSEFEQTSGPVKAFVGGLTDLFVLISGGNEEEALAAAAPKVRHTVLLHTMDLLLNVKLAPCTWSPSAMISFGISRRRPVWVEEGTLLELLMTAVYLEASLLFQQTARNDAVPFSAADKLLWGSLFNAFRHGKKPARWRELQTLG